MWLLDKIRDKKNTISLEDFTRYCICYCSCYPIDSKGNVIYTIEPSGNKLVSLFSSHTHKKNESIPYLSTVIKFHSEEPEIRNHLIAEAINNDDYRTFLLYWKDNFVGYYTLGEKIGPNDEAYLNIKALGRDSRYCGCHIGYSLIYSIFRTLRYLNHNRGKDKCFRCDKEYELIYLDSKYGAASYYIRNGFVIDKVESSRRAIIMVSSTDEIYNEVGVSKKQKLVNFLKILIVRLRYHNTHICDLKFKDDYIYLGRMNKMDNEHDRGKVIYEFIKSIGCNINCSDFEKLEKLTQTSTEYPKILAMCCEHYVSNKTAAVDEFKHYLSSNIRDSFYILSSLCFDENSISPKLSHSVTNKRQEMYNSFYELWSQENWSKYIRFLEQRKMIKDYENIVLKHVYMPNIEMSHLSLDGMTIFESNLSGANFEHSSLVGVNFTYSNLENVNFKRANLSNANLTHANLRGANFSNANLSGAYLSYSQLEGAIFSYTNIKDAVFVMSSVDSSTIFKGNSKHFANKHTDFSGVSLSTSRINPNLLSYLERNIRQIYWNKWYKKHKILQIPVRIFWSLSDYGTNSKLTFICLGIVNVISFILITLYWNIHELIIESSSFNLTEYIWGLTNDIPSYLSLYTSTSGESTFVSVFMFLLSIINYIFLAIFITRLAIMFQNKSP
ncbi:MAG: pentapeptide repeat-containing protein [Methanocorpusculum parvum]|nr:pentapeptide repeat-containing protein [Methanocorpusculum parvum]